MNSRSSRSTGDTRLGAILTRSGLVSGADVRNGLAVSATARLPLGNVLILKQKLTRSQLRLTIEAQWMIKDGLLPSSTAFTALNLAKRNNWSLSDALIALGTEAYPKRGARLGDLLIRTKIVNEAQLAEELEMGALTGLPLGRVMIARKSVSEGTVWHAIQLQQEVRSDRMDLEDAAERLITIHNKLILTDNHIAELLVAANRLRRKEVEVAVEMAEANNKKFSDILMDMNWLEPELLERAISVQSFLRSNRINFGEAIEFLRNDNYDSAYLSELRRTELQQRLLFCDFLRLNDYLDAKKLKDVVNRLAADEPYLLSVLREGTSGDKRRDIKTLFYDHVGLSKVLQHFYPDDIHSLYCAKAAFLSIEDGSLTPEEALIKYVEVSRTTEPSNAGSPA